MGIKKHDLCYLIGVKKGCQKTHININIFFDTPAGGQCDVSRALSLRTTPDTLTLTIEN